MKSRIGVQKNWYDHWECFNNKFKAPQQHGDDSEATKVGAARVKTEIC